MIPRSSSLSARPWAFPKSSRPPCLPLSSCAAPPTPSGWRSSIRGSRVQGGRAAAEAGNAGLQEDFDRAQAELEAAKAHREGLRTASAGRRGRLELLDERLESHDREMSRLRTEADRGRGQIVSWR